MSRATDLTGLLRWYPRAWRDRYGDELTALIEDTLAGASPTAAMRLSIARAGLAERARSGGWTGRSASPEVQVRAGALVVLCGWTAIVIAGAAVAKLGEHFDATLPPSAGTAATNAWRAVEVAAVAASIAVVLAAALALPGFLRARRQRRYPDLGHLLGAAALATALAGAATAGLVAWASTLSVTARESADRTYALAFLGWSALVALCVVSWTNVAVAAGGRITFTRAELAGESALALVVAVCMTVVAGATAVWWRAVPATLPGSSTVPRPAPPAPGWICAFWSSPSSWGRPWPQPCTA